MRNNNLTDISISKLRNQYKIGEGIENDFLIISNLREHINILSKATRLNELAVCVCTSGNLNITLNLSDLNITKNTYLLALPGNIVKINNVSKDFNGYVIVVTFDLLRKININLKEIFPYYILVKNKQYIETNSTKIERISKLCELIECTLGDINSIRKNDIVNGLISSMIYIICEELDNNDFIKKLPIQTKSKEYYFINFLELLSNDFKQEHTVGYYSTKLGLTPKYLSSLIKEISGLSAADWINDYIIMESKLLLHFSDAKIKEIADYLNFPNQSFFCKFFKHHTQQTPGNYRSKC